jgi:hypothetical protein
MRVFGDGQLPAGRRAQDVAMPGGHREPTFGIETEGRSTLEHGNSDLAKHFSPLNCTFSHCITKPQRHATTFTIFFNGINDLERIQKANQQRNIKPNEALRAAFACLG